MLLFLKLQKNQLQAFKQNTVYCQRRNRLIDQRRIDILLIRKLNVINPILDVY